MNTSERITIIQKISEELKGLDWSVIDLTLSQFGLPTDNNVSWENDLKAYSIRMIEAADNETLSQLHSHLTDKDPSTSLASSLDFWQPGTFRVFLSHRTSYKKDARKLKDKLDQFHISSFLAHEDIKPTKKWQDEIELALDTTDCLIALVTDDFHKSDWTDQELGIAMGKNKLIISIDCGGKPYGFLSKYQWLKVKEIDPDYISSEVFEILTKHTLSKRKFSSALVNKLESSHTFKAAKKNMGLLEKVEYLDEELLGKIQSAHDSNSQISDSFGLTFRVQRLLKKMSQK